MRLCWVVREARQGANALVFQDGVILARGLSISEFTVSSAAVGAGGMMRSGTICCVQKEVVVSAIGVGKMSGDRPFEIRI
eukprot:scaffold22381_cov118-Isochrysis_galbana.AAC.5